MSAQRLNGAIRLGLMAMVVAALGACGTATVVRPSGSGGGSARPVSSSAPRTSVAQPGKTVRVQRGDTIYALARIHSITPADLIAWNALSNPSTIYPGQTIRLYPPGAAGGRAPTAAATPRTPAGSGPAAAAAAATPAPVRSSIAWRWPADGTVVGRFVAGETTRQGVDIAGTGGQAVKAAADGVVVYSGAGLVGYGELIIVKHNEQWLSAYGHNRKRLVNEGQSVKAGQQIAEMGRTGANRDMLHFEIRYNGKPVDPQQYLPAR